MPRHVGILLAALVLVLAGCDSSPRGPSIRARGPTEAATPAPLRMRAATAADPPTRGVSTVADPPTPAAPTAGPRGSSARRVAR